MKLLITGAWRCSKDRLDEIVKMGHEIVFMQSEWDELPCDPTEIEGVICNGLFIYHDIQSFSNLRYIQLVSAGYDRVPTEYIAAHGIETRNARGVYSKPMAEYAVCGVLQIYKRSKFFYENQKRHNWEKKRDLLELCGKTVLIVGCGSVGTECAKRFKAFDCLVYGVDIKESDCAFFDKFFGLKDLDSILSVSDIVVLCLPLDKSTYRFFNASRFEKLKSGCVFVNIARGAVVDEGALIDALDNKLMGAVLDVFEQEPLSVGSKIWDMENVIIMPHNAFIGDGNDKRLFELIVNNLRGRQ